MKRKGIWILAAILFSGIVACMAAHGGDFSPAWKARLIKAERGVLPSGSIGSSEIADGTIVNADLASSATSNALMKVYCSNLVVKTGGTVLIDAKEAVVAPSTTRLQLDRGTATNGQPIVHFTAAFAVAPSVVFGWHGDVSAYSTLTNTHISAASVSTTSCVPKTAVAVGGLLTNMYWIAVSTE